MEIDDISVQEIPEASIDTTIISIPEPLVPENIGFPVIQMPGCVRARNLKNKNLVTNDERGNFYVCDGNMPTLESMAVDWDGATVVEPEQQEEIKQETPKIVPPVLPKKSKRKKRKEVEEKDGKDNEEGNTDVGQQDLKAPTIDGQFIVDKLPCPPLDTLAKTPIGSLGKGGLARIKGWRRDQVTNKCETVWEGLNPIEIAGNYAPPVPLLVSTSAIAVTSILAVGTLQPYIKIVQKQIQKQIKKRSKKLAKSLFKKKEKVLSLSERRTQQRDLRK